MTRWLLAVCLVTGTALADTRKSEAVAVLERAIAHEKEPGVLDKALAELDQLAARHGRDADVHYARGWVLSHLGRAEDSIVAYDRAFELDKSLADAAYNAGVVLGRTGRPREAAEHFDRALAANPKHVDAAYNAGQAYYDAQIYPKAAERWQQAAALAPNDFQIAKKLVQAYVRQKDDTRAAAARERVFELHKTDPAAQKLASYVYDQFDVGANHVFAYEDFDEAPFIYQFTVTDGDRAVGAITFEKRRDGQYGLGLERDGKHEPLAKTWKDRPDYRTIKTEATKEMLAAKLATK